MDRTGVPDRKGFLVGFLAGGWLATVVVLVALHAGLPQAAAQGGGTTTPPPGGGPVGPGGSGTVPVGPSVNPLDDTSARGIVNPGLGTSDSNGRAIALSASFGGGQSVVYYFDTEAKRLCVYMYSPGTRGGLRLLAARLIDFDLRLESYKDLSEKSPREMREAYEKAMGLGSTEGRPGDLPTKRVDLPPGGG